MIEVAIYGILCTICSVAAICSDPRNLAYSVICTLAISLFWVGNILLWSFDAIEYYVLTDSAFALSSFALAAHARVWWIAILGICFSGNVALDIIYLNEGLGYSAFAWMSNALFIAELFIASHRGWFRIIKGKLDPGL